MKDNIKNKDEIYLLEWCHIYLKENPCVKIEQSFKTYNEFLDLLKLISHNDLEKFYKFLVKTDKERMSKI